MFHNLLISRKLQKERALPFADLKQLSPTFAHFGRIFSHRFSHRILAYKETDGSSTSTRSYEKRIHPKAWSLSLSLQATLCSIRTKLSGRALWGDRPGNQSTGGRMMTVGRLASPGVPVYAMCEKCLAYGGDSRDCELQFPVRGI